MDDKSLVKLLKEYFYTKPEMEERFATKDDLERFATKGDLSTLAREMREGFGAVNEKLDNLTASSRAVDTLLEAHPIERIERLEAHAHLLKYSHAGGEE